MNIRTGLIVPAATALDENGELIEEEQRRLLRHCIEGGASAIFSPGTTGEFPRLRNGQRNQLMEIAVEEVSRYRKREIWPQSWPVVNGTTVSQTLENLRLALDLRVDAVVIAPLAIVDLERQQIADFLREVVSRVKEHSRRMPVCLYENPEISKHESLTLLPPEILRKICEMPEITAMKISADAAAVQTILDELTLLCRSRPVDIYLGYAALIFTLDVPNLPVAGIVSGAGNLFPKQWSLAWNAVAGGNRGWAAACQEPLESLEKAIGSKYVSAIKWGLVEMGILSQHKVANGTRALSDDEGQEFLEKFRVIKRQLERVSSV